MWQSSFQCISTFLVFFRFDWRRRCSTSSTCFFWTSDAEQFIGFPSRCWGKKGKKTEKETKEKENKEKDKDKHKEKANKETKKDKKLDTKNDKEKKQKKKKRKQDDSAEEVFKNVEDKSDDDEADDQGEEAEEEGGKKPKKKPSARTKNEKQTKSKSGRGRGGGKKKKHDVEGNTGSQSNSVLEVEKTFRNLSLQDIAALAEGDNIKESEDCWFEFSMFQKLCLVVRHIVI